MPSERHEHESHRHRRRRTRSRSPRREDDKHRDKRRRSRSPQKPVTLPYKAKQLSKRQYEEYKPLFQSYLDIQKQIHLEDLDEREIRGRWKSFVSRWNRGELARSWYDPSMLKSAQDTALSQSQFHHDKPPTLKRGSPVYTSANHDADSQSDDDFGPAPPQHISRGTGHGPSIPSLDDLTYRNELRDEEHAQGRSEYIDDLRHARKSDRKTQKERLEELAPRADPGSRERQLEKKRETTSALQSFRDAKEGGDVDVAEEDLMGDDGDAFKKKRREEERKLTEREIKREEIARAREAERSERLSERREKEAKTMAFLQQIARERFG